MQIHIYIHGSGADETERFETLLDRLEKLEGKLTIDISKLQDALTREATLESQLEALVQAGGDPALQAALDDLAVKSQARSDAMQAVIDSILPPVTTGTGSAGTSAVDPALAQGHKTGN